MGQPVAFFEVISPDYGRAQKFYSELFGWQVAADPAMGGYGLVDTGAGTGAIGGGIGPGHATGQEGELRASAVVIEGPGGGKACLVACDVLMVERDVLDAAAREIA